MAKKAESQKDRKLRVDRHKHRESAKRAALTKEAEEIKEAKQAGRDNAAQNGNASGQTGQSKTTMRIRKAIAKSPKLQAYLSGDTVQMLIRNKAVVYTAYVIYALIIIGLVSGVGYGGYLLFTKIR